MVTTTNKTGSEIAAEIFAALIARGATREQAAAAVRDAFARLAATLAARS